MTHLLFTQEIRSSNSLIYGNLALIYDTGEIINYIACSGATGRQSKAFLWKPGKYGAIPSGKYWIPTKGYVSNLPGIAGLFFHIQPDPVSSLGSRSELGIHWDGNAPGSAGCIVLKNKSSFDTFCQRLAKLSEQGVRRLDLLVEYASVA